MFFSKMRIFDKNQWTWRSKNVENSAEWVFFRLSMNCHFTMHTPINVFSLASIWIRTYVNIPVYLTLFYHFYAIFGQNWPFKSLSYPDIENPAVFYLGMRNSTFFNFEKNFTFCWTSRLVILVMFVSEWDFCLWKSPRVK